MHDINLHIKRQDIDYSIKFPQDFETLATQLAAQINDRNFLIITDENIFNKSSLFQKSGFFKNNNQVPLDKGGMRGISRNLLILPPGEKYKNWSSIEKILDKAFSQNLDRSSLLIAIGGGVVGDMVGFASHIFMRGIPFIQIPTTLLAMVDSSVGGKTGIDSPFGKNLIGAFHQPEAVFCCTKFLESLPEVEIKNGLCEMIKHGMIHHTPENPHFEELEKLSEKYAPNSHFLEGLVPLISQSIAIKKHIVQQDEQESGTRENLNLGHTFGHAIELLSEFKIPHGQAVAMGILKSIEYAKKYGVLEDESLEKRLQKMLKNFGISTEHNFSDAEIIEAMQHDKKKKRGQIRLILPQRIGQVCPHRLNI
jgi:3-dehydroquinate synthase